VEGSMEYKQNNNNEYCQLRKLACAGCGGTKATTYDFLPNDFFVRILGKERTTFCQTRLPGFKNTVIGSLIQYNANTKHFRCIKMSGKQFTLILDGNQLTRFKLASQRKSIIEDEQWTNYIASFHFLG
jgi:hypothetical protein